MAEDGGQLWNMKIESGDSGNPWDMSIPSGESSKEHQDLAAAKQQAMYDYLDAGKQYGGRSLRTPDGRADRAHYVYSRSTPHHHNRPHYSRRQSHNYGWRSSGGDRVPRWTHAQGGPPPREGFFGTLFGVIFDLFSR